MTSSNARKHQQQQAVAPAGHDERGERGKRHTERDTHGRGEREEERGKERGRVGASRREGREEGREGEWERARGQEERRGERRRGDGEEGREGEGGGRERAETHTERDTRGVGAPCGQGSQSFTPPTWQVFLFLARGATCTDRM